MCTYLMEGPLPSNSHSFVTIFSQLSVVSYLNAEPERIAIFDLKVGRRKRTKIENLAVCATLLVVLTVLPYHM